MSPRGAAASALAVCRLCFGSLPRSRVSGTTPILNSALKTRLPLHNGSGTFIQQTMYSTGALVGVKALHHPERIRVPVSVLLLSSSCMRAYSTTAKAPQVRLDKLVSAKDLPKTMLLIDQDGKRVGETVAQDAVKLAKERRCVFAMVNANGSPPVVRLLLETLVKQEIKREKQKLQEQKMLERQKKTKGKAKDRAKSTKEVQMTSWVADHDFGVKLGKINKFLQKGHKVHVLVKHRKGQVLSRQQQNELVEKIVGAASENGELDSSVKEMGRFATGLTFDLRPLASPEDDAAEA